ncbi:MAG: lipopolysaccharide kinase InaA family protein [Burkholderiales bacterium]
MIRCAFKWRGSRLFIASGWREKLASIGISGQSNDWETVTKGDLVSASSSITQCYKVALNSGESIYFKRYTYNRDRFRYWLRRSKAMTEVWGYGELSRIGIPVPEILAYGEQRQFGFLRAAFIVTLAVGESKDLKKFTDELQSRIERKQTYRILAKQLASQLRAAHEKGFFHHDLKWKNILVRQTAGGSSLHWIDCPRAHHKAFHRQRAVVCDLASLARDARDHLSPFEQLRFLHDYLGDEFDKAALRNLVRKINDRVYAKSAASLVHCGQALGEVQDLRPYTRLPVPSSASFLPAPATLAETRRIEPARRSSL